MKYIIILVSLICLNIRLTFGDSIPDYTNTCAARLFNEPNYTEILNSGSPLVDKIIGDAKRGGWPPPAIFSVPSEYQQANAFLIYLTNSYPRSVASFITTDHNSNVAQAVWASVLENYQDGGSRLVIPNDIRTLIFMCRVVLPIGIEGTNNLDQFQYMDAKMVYTGAKLVLESVRQWDGDLALVDNPNTEFTRVAHEAFWNMLVTYIGIIKVFEPEYAYQYLEDLILCRQENISRWLWDSNYCAKIRSKYAPDLADQFWFEPYKYIPVLIEWEFAQLIPDILNWTGSALIELTDNIIEYGIPAKDENAKILLTQICAYIRGAASVGGSENDLTDKPSSASGVLSIPPIHSSVEYHDALKKWLYFFHLHWRLYDNQKARTENPWISNLVRKKLPLLEQQLSASSSSMGDESLGAIGVSP